MATPGQLVEKLSEVLAVPGPTLTVFDRVLRDAGLLSKGGRGRSSVQRTPLDAARLLVALLGTSSPARAAEVVRDFGVMQCEHVQINNPDRLTLEKLWPGGEFVHAFENAIAAIIAGFGDEAFRQVLLSHSHEIGRDMAEWIGATQWLPHLWISVSDTKLTASINIEGNLYIYNHPSQIAYVRSKARLHSKRMQELGQQVTTLMERYRGIRTERQVAMPEIKPIAEFVCGVTKEDRV